MLKFSKQEKQIGERIMEKFAKEREKNQRFNLVTFKELFAILDSQEIKLLNKVLKIDPKKYGQNAPFIGVGPAPKNLVAIKNQREKSDYKNIKLPTQYLPRPVFDAFSRLNQAIKKDLGRKLNVYGYRSPAYQLVVLFRNIYFANWRVKEALKKVLAVGYSQHSDPKFTAVDFALQKSNKKRNFSPLFSETKEYKWLQKNAGKFGFFLSYTRGNKSGVMFEPWHWRYKKPQA